MTPIDSTAMPLPPGQSPTLADRALDTINPLQHIPFVGFLYRQVTGDTITPEASFAGGLLYGGPIGAIGAVASMIVGGAIDTARGESGFASAFGFDTREAHVVQPRIIDPWKFNE